jgi:hypothetical protein
MIRIIGKTIIGTSIKSQKMIGIRRPTSIRTRKELCPTSFVAGAGRKISDARVLRNWFEERSSLAMTTIHERTAIPKSPKLSARTISVGVTIRLRI